MLEGVPPVVANTLIAELAAGERVVWHAMPSFGRKLREPILTLLFALIIAVMLGGMLWLHRLAAPLGQLGTRLEMTVDLLLFGGFTLEIAFMLLIIWRLYRRTLYAITDRRAIVIHAFWRRRIQSFTGEQLIRAVRIEDKHGSGDILFERHIGFRGLKNTRAVAKLLRQTYEAEAKAENYFPS
jgi:hypothetical protein